MAVATTTAIALGIAAVSAGLGAYSSIQQGQAAKSAAEYNAAVARNNAAASQTQASEEAARSRSRTRRALSSQRAQFAKSGAMVSGSALDVLYDSSIQGEMDALSIEYRGAVEANRYMAQAGLNRMEGRSASQAGYLQGAGSILGGASNMSLINRQSKPSFGDY